MRVSWAEGHPYTISHNHYHSGGGKCVGVMGNGERLQQCSTKPLVYRVPPKEIQGSWHSWDGSHSGFGLSQCLTANLGGDQEYGHSTEMWGLGWSNPRQDYSIHHGRVGHSCNGLIHQVYGHPVSQMYSVWGFVLTGGLPLPPVS